MKFTKSSLKFILLAYALIPIQFIAFILFKEGGFIISLVAGLFIPLAQLLSLVLFIVTLITWKKTSNHILPSIPFLLVIAAIIASMSANYVANMYGMYSLAFGIENYFGHVSFIVMIFVVLRYDKFVKQSIETLSIQS